MDFQEKKAKYREDSTNISSPAWIFYAKTGNRNEVACQICKTTVAQKDCVIPATQNADERLFSMVARNTGPLCRSIKISTIEKKVVVGKSIANHGFRFHFNGANASSSGDELDSF